MPTEIYALHTLTTSQTSSNVILKNCRRCHSVGLYAEGGNYTEQRLFPWAERTEGNTLIQRYNIIIIIIIKAVRAVSSYTKMLGNYCTYRIIHKVGTNNNNKKE